MVQRARSGRQLAIELPPELLQRLKAHAAASGRPVSGLVRQWIEEGLAAEPRGGEAPGLAASIEELRGDVELGSARLSRCMNGQAEMLQRLGALEAAVAALQKPSATAPPARATKPAPAAPSDPLELELDLSPSEPHPSGGGSTITRMGDAPAGAVTTAELADALGMKRGSLNERLRRMGGAREGLELEGWRCCGQVAPPSGGPPRWVWERA
jgi:hypothetical protein